ncbi:hypothetical protein [Noviherbaspirillum soli]|uniref:hypothetical protein n=1 Tax=Noviherbaspirillum soli TaxID=1064518 RepID=UPI00188D442B|nr:hypothetical protein [Noviherbaspirillum soli]
MDTGPGAVRVVVIVLAAIGALAVLGSFGMLFMHGAMMGGLPFQGAFSSMLAACRGMMGG